MRIFFRSLSVLLSGILAAGSCLEAQNVTPADTGDIQQLHLRVVGDSGSARNSSQPVAVVVTDGNNSPVANATVLFRLPSDAPGGVFSDGSRVAVVYSDTKGLAEIKSIQWNATSGTATIRVTATKGTAHAGLLIEQVLSRAKNSAARIPADDHAAAEHTALAQPSPALAPAPLGQPAETQAEHPKRPVIISAQGATVSGSPRTEEPTVQITTSRPSQLTGASGKSKKWLWIGLGTAAAAGAAVAFAGKGGASNTQTPGSPSLSIGTPSVSIGRP